MTSPENAPTETERDLQQELTELEYRASQGQLNADDAQRLKELQEQRGEIAGSVHDYAGHATDAGNTVSGDDSP
jgi:hypothetical protein